MQFFLQAFAECSGETMSRRWSWTIHLPAQCEGPPSSANTKGVDLAKEVECTEGGARRRGGTVRRNDGLNFHSRPRPSGHWNSVRSDQLAHQRPALAVESRQLVL